MPPRRRPGRGGVAARLMSDLTREDFAGGGLRISARRTGTGRANGELAPATWGAGGYG